MIELNNTTRNSFINEELLKTVAERVLRGEKKSGQNLSIAIVGKARAQKLNQTYRKKDTVANVLSFEGTESDVGEVVLCPQQIRKDAVQYGISFEQAILWMLVHGILHLAGYDHEKEQDATRMEKREQHYLSVYK